MMLLTMITAIGSELIPYSPRTDDFISVLLLLCFFLTAFVFARNKKYFILQLKNFFSHRERASIFSSSTSVDIRMLMLLALQTCVLTSVFVFNIFIDASSPKPLSYSSWMPITAFAGAAFVFFLLKNLFYMFLGWVFATKSETDRWIEAYLTLFNHVGFLLFPVVLFLIYFDLQLAYLVIIALFFIVSVKMLMLFKWWRFFFRNKSGSLLLIVYFCALEIIPCFLLYRGLVGLNELLTIKL